MNWIRPAKRLAIYLRDGLACAYCGEGVEDGAKLTLDHLRPHKSGGSNSESNLVTCCHRCNTARSARSWKQFSERAAGYLNHGVTAEAIIAHIEATRKRRLDLTAAKELIERPRRSREHLLRIVDKGAQRAEGDLVAAAHRGEAGRQAG